LKGEAMTKEDKNLIAEYMNDEGALYNCAFDCNYASLCVQEMQKRGEWFDFYWFAIGNSSSEALTAWLFNPDNFFAAFVEWRKGK
jgi:hypothetical protein